LKPETARSLIVSLHDVAPVTFDAARRQLDELAGLGVSRVSLLVVPFYHRQQRLGGNDGFCEWLRECQAKGHEIVLHGFSHQLDQANIAWRPSRPPFAGESKSRHLFSFRNLHLWFLENLYTNREAEFLNCDYTTAHSKIETGLKMLQEAGFQVTGFIAPAWLMNPNVEKAAHDLGLRYTNTLTELIDLEKEQRYSTQSCVWSTRAAWRRWLSLKWNDRLFQRLAGTDPLRISIHPADHDHPAIWAQVRELIATALKDRQVTTYAEWVAARNA
jgi:predicted deacetylase